MDYKNYIASKLNIDGVSTEEISSLIVTPPDTSLGDYALPCFKFAKILLIMYFCKFEFHIIVVSNL